MTSLTGATGGNTRATSTGKWAGDKVPSGYKAGALQQFTPEQLGLFQQLFGHLGPESYLSRLAGGDQSSFEQMEAPAMRQFAGLQGNIASRFSGMGMGGRRSSGFQNTLGQAGQDFAANLQSQRQGLQRQALLDLMGLSESLLGQRPYQRTLTPKPENQWGGVLGGLASALPSAIGGFI